MNQVTDRRARLQACRHEDLLDLGPPWKRDWPLNQLFRRDVGSNVKDVLDLEPVPFQVTSMTLGNPGSSRHVMNAQENALSTSKAAIAKARINDGAPERMMHQQPRQASNTK